jgi:hypothetical protein
MDTQARRRSLIVWLLLSAITFGYLVLDGSVDNRGAYHASDVVTVVVILLALAKARFIFREFMQARNAPALLGRLCDLWIVLIGTALLGSYLAGQAVR